MTLQGPPVWSVAGVCGWCPPAGAGRTPGPLVGAAQTRWVGRVGPPGVCQGIHPVLRSGKPEPCPVEVWAGARQGTVCCSRASLASRPRLERPELSGGRWGCWSEVGLGSKSNSAPHLRVLGHPATSGPRLPLCCGARRLVTSWPGRPPGCEGLQATGPSLRGPHRPRPVIPKLPTPLTPASLPTCLHPPWSSSTPKPRLLSSRPCPSGDSLQALASTTRPARVCLP